MGTKRRILYAAMVSLFVFASQFSDVNLSVVTVAVGAIALVSVILGALLSGDAYLAGDSSDPVSTGGN